jgi:hypothetical protein
MRALILDSRWRSGQISKKQAVEDEARLTVPPATDVGTVTTFVSEFEGGR